MLVTRLTYCQGGGRFTHPECALLVEQITDLDVSWVINISMRR
jgi:hypothetical protein